MLEKMEMFFKDRVNNYDEHMLNNIEGANQFYKFTAQKLPMNPESQVLDLGCGTGLELEEYFGLNPDANVVGIDLSVDMLKKLKNKLPNNNIKLVCSSYFDVDFGHEKYDAAVSVESLHHFTAERKLQLYDRLHNALKSDGYFILTDYFAESDVMERECFENLKKLKEEQGIKDGGDFYHYDTPLTVNHEIDVLKKAKFSEVKVLNNWGATYTILAKK